MTAIRLYAPLLTLKPANSIVASLGIGMHALSSSMRMKTPGRPRSATTLVANSTIGSVRDATTNTSAQATDRAIGARHAGPRWPSSSSPARRAIAAPTSWTAWAACASRAGRRGARPPRRRVVAGCSRVTASGSGAWRRRTPPAPRSVRSTRVRCAAAARWCGATTSSRCARRAPGASATRWSTASASSCCSTARAGAGDPVKVALDDPRRDRRRAARCSRPSSCATSRRTPMSAAGAGAATGAAASSG